MLLPCYIETATAPNRNSQRATHLVLMLQPHAFCQVDQQPVQYPHIILRASCNTAMTVLRFSVIFLLHRRYGLPSTEPAAAVTRAFTAALASSQQLPRPVPPHSSSSSSSKTHQQQQRQDDTAAAAPAAPADTQFALLQLHALGAHGLGLGLLNCYPSADAGGFGGNDSYNSGYNSVSNGQGSSVGELVAQLLRVAGHSANPLDCSTAWQLLGVLQAVGALPSRRQECE
jgi:hypothetical protein